jgi:zinc protease
MSKPLRFIGMALLGLALTYQALAKPVLKIAHWRTTKNIPVYFVASHEVPMLDVVVGFYAGSSHDGNQLGLAQLTADSLGTGTQQASADLIAQSFAKVGAQFNASSDKDLAVVSLRSLTTPEKLDLGLHTFNDVLSQPNFLAAEVALARANLLAALQFQRQIPEAIASETFDNLVYAHTPYAHSILGTQATLERLTEVDVQNFYKQFYIANNALIVLVGDQTLVQAKAIAETISLSLPLGTQPTAPDIQFKPSTALVKNIDFNSQQTHIMLGLPCINYKHPAYIPLSVGSYILGGNGLSSLLFSEIRKKRGLTYGAYSKLDSQLALGSFTISLATRNEQADKATLATTKLLQMYTQQGPSEQQLMQAKQFLLGNFPLQLGSNSAIANLLLQMAAYQLPVDYYDHYLASVRKLDRKTVHQAWRQFIDPAQLIVVKVGSHVKQQG